MRIEKFFWTFANRYQKNNYTSRFFKKIQSHPFLLFIFIATAFLTFSQLSFANYFEPIQLNSAPAYSSFLTDDLTKKKPKKKFSCMNQIYLYFLWKNVSGTHEITAFWINPKGKQQNQINLKFTANKPKVENWIALKFNNFFNEKYPFFPNISTAKLIGKWRVKILLDGNLLETKNFQVNCG